MTKYGMPYRGSKQAIADDIIAVLPSGKRFIDLFGGGFAMSQCALMSGKYDKVVYSDYNEPLIRLLRDAFAGQYNYTMFVPEFITREEFFARKDTDAYVRWIWSFGNNGKDYLFAKDLEPKKHALHDFVVLNKRCEFVDGLLGKDFELPDADIKTRRLAYGRRIKELDKRCDLEHLQQLERLQQLECLEQLEHLERLQGTCVAKPLDGGAFPDSQLEMICRSYTEYEYEDGDVVYCDPPYDNRKNKRNYYSCDFDFSAFLDWVATRDYPVYFSSYPIEDGRFELVWNKEKNTAFPAQNNGVRNLECLYRNKI